MTDKSSVLYDGRHYVACYMRGGIVTVQSKQRGMRGQSVKGDAAHVWRRAFEDAIDAAERHDLCRGFLQT